MQSSRVQRFRASAAVLLLLSALPSPAAEYFVAPSGSDRSPGTEALPFQTIARAVAVATSPGDVITLRDGVYRPRNTINFGRPGSADRPITLRSAAGEQAIVDGTDTPADTSLFSVNTHHIQIDGLTIRNAHGNAIVVYGPGSRVHNIRVTNNQISNCQLSGVYAGNNRLNDPVRDLVFEGNTIQQAVLKNRSRNAGSWSFAIGAGLSKNVTIRDNEISNSYGEGIGLYLSDAGLIAGNRVHDCFSVNLYLDNTTNTRVERNLIYSTGDKDFYRFNRPANGISIANENYGGLRNPCSDNIIVNNILTRNVNAFYVGNYQQGGGLRNSIFAHNTCVDSTDRPLHIDADRGHANSLIANNIFFRYEARQTPLTDVEQPLEGIRFATNLWSGGVTQPSTRHDGDVQAIPFPTRTTSVAANSFQITLDSPAAYGATPLDDITSDFSDAQFPRRRSIGAWEARPR